MPDYGWTMVRVRKVTRDAVHARGRTVQRAVEEWLGDHALVDTAVATAGSGHLVDGPHGEIVADTGEVRAVPKKTQGVKKDGG